MRIAVPTFLFIFCNCLFATDYTEVGLPIITNYTQSEYDAHNQNWDVTQAENQLIYVANGNGLLEFDGETWTKYNTPNHSRLRDIEIVGSKIYAGTLNDLGVFEKGDKGQLNYRSFNALIDSKYLPYGEVWSIVSDGTHVVFKTSDYFFIYDGQTIRTVKDTSNSRVKMVPVDNKVYVKLIGDERVYALDFNHQKILNKTPWLLPNKAQIRSIIKDTKGDLLFFTGKSGIFRQQDTELKKMPDNFKKGTYVYDAIQSKEGLFYVATINQGLYLLSEDLNTVKNYHDIHGLGMNAITTVMNDKQNNIWLAGNKAISVMRPPTEISRYQMSENAYGFNFLLIQNKLSYLGKGLFQLQQNHQDSFYPPQFEKVEGVEDDIWNALDYDEKTFFATNKGIKLLHIKNSTLIQEEIIMQENLFVFNIVATDDFKQLFAATSMGLFHLQKHKDNWLVQQVKGFESEINALQIENNKILWAGNSSAQLFRIDINSLNSNKPQIELFDSSHGIGNNKVVPFKLSMGIVFATNDGVMRYTGDDEKPLKFIENMPEIFSTINQDAHMLYEDTNNRLWYRIGSHSGFAFKKGAAWMINEEVFKYFPIRSIDAFVSKEKDVLWFVQSDDSIFRMDVNKTKNLPPLAPLYIRKVQNLNSNNTIASGHVTALNESLTFNSNSLRVNYAMAAYAIPAQAVYRSKLIGARKPQWSEWSDETYKDFTELRGNDYILEVQAKDGFGRISTSTQLQFTVLPPFYLSKAALILYLLLTVIFLVFAAWIMQRWRTRKLQIHNVQLAALVDKKTIEIQGHISELEQQQELKTRFFTNISHELRTPLSLIILPLQKLINSNQKNLDKESQELLSLSLKNATGMKLLVNQVLDVSRFEQKTMPLAVQKNDLVQFVGDVSLSFIEWAEENEQQIKVISCDEKIELYFDPQMMEKIISNLLSNAIKYSGKGSSIKISFFSNNKQAGFAIKDNGIGIAKAQCKDVFQRHFQSIENSNADDSLGIGLNFVKEMVDLHHGKIELISDTGQGCEFRLTFKLGKSHFSTIPDQKDKTLAKQLEQKQHPEDTPLVLIVEDNSDLRNFISQSLSIQYKVIQAINGDDALKILIHELPDLIISDIMMPQMDGIEFLQKIRQQEQFKTIPFFLLSSKATQGDTLVGLQYGADDYLTKPFDMDELLLRVKNMINSRRLIRKELQHQLQEIKKSTKVKVSNFEQKLRGIIIDNVSDSRFSVSVLAETIGMERTTLFRKVKKEFNISPSKYIQLIRLEIAKELLDNKGLSVSEIAYASGFESLSYFSKTFKNTYGKVPSNMENHR